MIVLSLAITMIFGRCDVFAAEIDVTPEYQETEEVRTVKEAEREFVFLSDIPYIKDQSYATTSAGYEGGKIHLDENDSGQILALKVDGQKKQFTKGICAWANSQLVYDLRDVSYDYLTAYLGVDMSEAGGDEDRYDTGGVVFYIYQSEDGENWGEPVYQSDVHYARTDAEQIKINIKDVNYLKLYADDHSDAWWGYMGSEAVYADAKLCNEGYSEDVTTVEFIKTVGEYDAIIKQHFGEEIVGEYEAAILQRTFVNRVGYELLQELAGIKTAYKETIQWLLNDTEALRLYLVGGLPQGNYLNSVKVLSDLYTNYKDTDLLNTQNTLYGTTTYQEMYRTMILALALTHSGNMYYWNDTTVVSDPIERYEIYKDLYAKQKIECEMFEKLTVEEMRWVMNTIISNEEIVWLNDYVREKGEGNTDPYHYITYDWDEKFDYSKEIYYSQENYAKWDEKYQLSKYGITYEKGHPRQWIVFEENAVCGGISKTGTTIWGAYKGLPNTCVSQPAHCAFVCYKEDENGNGIWTFENSGYENYWAVAGQTEHLNERRMNDWGNSAADTNWYSASYLLLAQAAQNEYAVYEDAEVLLMLADVYAKDPVNLEKIYHDALEIETINYDAWMGLIDLYKADTAKTDEDWCALAQKAAAALTYYPFPMNDLLNQIKANLTSDTYRSLLELLQTKTLKMASNATNAQVLQADMVKQVAEGLLGEVNSTFATFSFDGENAGKIVLANTYENSNFSWRYSLDGGSTWKETQEQSVQLTAEELASITAEHDIKMHIVGVAVTEENIYTIDITESNGLPENLYRNDQENILAGATDSMQWKYEEKDPWTAFGTEKPNLSGDQTLIVRAGGTGTQLPGKTTQSYTFSAETQDEKQTYLSIQNIEEITCSSEHLGEGSSYNAAANAFDGNIHTIWHTKHDGSDGEKWLVVKLKQAAYLSALEYVPRQDGSNGRAKAVKVELSLDGGNWETVGTASDWADDKEAKTVVFGESEEVQGIEAQYVRFTVTENHGSGNFACAAMINLYEDTTLPEEPAKPENPGVSVSTDQIAGVERPENASDTTTNPIENAFDGNSDTFWEAEYADDAKEKCIIIELKEEKYITALEYVPRQDDNNNGSIREASLYVSMDGKEWTKVGTSKTWITSKDSKWILVEDGSAQEPQALRLLRGIFGRASEETAFKGVRAKYVKLVAESVWSDNNYVSAAMINVFEADTTQGEPEGPDNPGELEKPNKPGNNGNSGSSQKPNNSKKDETVTDAGKNEASNTETVTVISRPVQNTTKVVEVPVENTEKTKDETAEETDTDEEAEDEEKEPLDSITQTGESLDTEKETDQEASEPETITPEMPGAGNNIGDFVKATVLLTGTVVLAVLAGIGVYTAIKRKKRG